MRVNIDALLVIISILWCEFGYYHFVLYPNCVSWPGIAEDDTNIDRNLTKLLVIADTHIMGPIKSFKVDKLRREWQMRQAFRISRRILRPDVVVFMGDLLDEGSNSPDPYFDEACHDFDRIFPHDDQNEERIIIAGNHDVGFHDRMRYIPYLMQRFRERFTATSDIELVQTPKTAHLNLVVSNSMSFYNDTCPFCYRAMESLNQLKLRLDQRRRNNPKGYAPPIFLGHIPLYRKNDLGCSYPASSRSEVAQDRTEGIEVLHKISSDALIEKVAPRLAISGHTHMLCITNHSLSITGSPNTFEEITLTSYNHKYAVLRPGFLLLTANSSQVFTKHCYLIDEWVVLSTYLITLFTILIRLIMRHRAQLKWKL